MTTKIAPGPSFLKLLTHASEAKKNLITPLQKFFDEYGNVFKIPMGFTSIYAFRTPEAAKEILQDKAKSMCRSYDGLKPLIGEGLLTSEGELWRKQRKMLSPLFHQKSIENFYQNILEETSSLVNTWKKVDSSNELIIDPYMMKTTLNVIARSLVSTDLSGVADQLGVNINVAMDFLVKNNGTVFPVPMFFPTKRNLNFKKAVKEIDRLIYDAIEKRREKVSEAKDMLDLLLNMREEQTGEGFSDRELRDHLITMILAGHESTASGLTWAFYLLAKNPKIQESLYQEIINHIQNSQAPKLEQLSSLVLLNQVCKEVLRLYPPFWYLERKTSEEVIIDGFKIPKGQRISLSPYFIHRNPEVWENPDEFIPQRFEENLHSARHKMSWIPFGGGARYCIGQPLAMLEIQTIIVELVRNFKFEVVEEHLIEMDPLISLRAKHGIKLRKTKR